MDPLAQRLRSERELQGLTIRDIAVVTKIREPYIEAIEHGHYDVLPAVYVRSFVRTLATAMAIPVAEVNQLMDEVFDLDKDTTAERLPRSVPPEPERPAVIMETVQSASRLAAEGAQKAGKVVATSLARVKALAPPTFFSYKSPIKWISGIVAVMIVAVLAFIIFGGSGSSEDVPDGAPNNEIFVTSENDALAADLDSMELTVEVSDTAWITITMDGDRTRQLVLVPGSKHLWRADEKFVLSVSNAGGVRFFRDNKSLPLFGQHGQAIRKVIITRLNVTSSNRVLEGDPSQVQAQPPPSRRRSATRRRNTNRPSMPIITPAPNRSPVERPSSDPDEE